MSWTLKSGRRIDTPACELFLCRYDGSSCCCSGLQTAGPDGPDYPSIDRASDPLTLDERQEIAAAVKAAWDEWLATGSAPRGGS